MKKYLYLSFIAIFLFACNKNTEINQNSYNDPLFHSGGDDPECECINCEVKLESFTPMSNIGYAYFGLFSCEGSHGIGGSNMEYICPSTGSFSTIFNPIKYKPRNCNECMQVCLEFAECPSRAVAISATYSITCNKNGVITTNYYNVYSSDNTLACFHHYTSCLDPGY